MHVRASFACLYKDIQTPGAQHHALLSPPSWGMPRGFRTLFEGIPWGFRGIPGDSADMLGDSASSGHVSGLMHICSAVSCRLY